MIKVNKHISRIKKAAELNRKKRIHLSKGYKTIAFIADKFSEKKIEVLPVTFYPKNFFINILVSSIF